MKERIAKSQDHARMICHVPGRKHLIARKPCPEKRKEDQPVEEDKKEMPGFKA